MFRDLQHGLRVLMKNPGFTVIAVISIAIGVGANAAMFSVADGLVFRPLPVPRASDKLMRKHISSKCRHHDSPLAGRASGMARLLQHVYSQRLETCQD